MKTDEEIKKWIDERNVLTKIELSKFILGYKRVYDRDKRLNHWWSYVLETKDWNALRKYKEEKINHSVGMNEHYRRFKEIYQSDLRLNGAGIKLTTRILNNIYNFNLSKTTIAGYLTRLRAE